MTIATALAIFVVLSAIATLHVAWGLGVWWPAGNEQELTAMAVGQTGRSWMPTPGQCFLAAAAIFGAGVMALLVAGTVRLPLPAGLITLGGVFVTLVFLGRGIAGYLPVWRNRFAEEPFASMDRRWYSPLCLAVAAGFVLLL